MLYVLIVMLNTFLKMNLSNSKILVTSPAWVGDIVMSQVLLRLLKENNPECVIDMVTPEWATSLIACMPEVRQAFPVAFKHGQFGLKDRWQLGAKLRQEKYTQAIVLQNSWKSALLPFAANIPQRTGWLGEFRYGLLNDIRYFDKKKLPYMVQRFAVLGPANIKNKLADLPKPALQVSEVARNNVLAKFNLDTDQKILALCPGAEYGPAKRWPAEYFAQIAQAKLAEDWAVCIFGGIKDQAIALEIQQATNQACIDLTGKTTLGEAAHLLSLAQVVVTNDSGLMHVAAALHRPLIAIYGSSSPGFTPPLNDQAKILSLNLSCSPCFQRECPLQHLNCLRNLSAQQVLTAMDGLLA